MWVVELRVAFFFAVLGAIGHGTSSAGIEARSESSAPRSVLVQVRTGAGSGAPDPTAVSSANTALARIRARHGSPSARPLARSAQAARRAAGAEGLAESRVDRIRKKFPHRSARANGTNPPDPAEWFVLEVPGGISAAEFAERLAADPDVISAEPDQIVRTGAAGPDPLLPLQWAAGNTGQTYPIGFGETATGRAGSDVRLAEALAVFQPVQQEVVVAVIDSGVDYNHPELANRMWTNEEGHYGYDFVNDDTDPIDDSGHGTHCAGIIAAEGNNSIGITGVCPVAKIMAVKAFNNVGLLSDAISAIYYAVDNGAEVLSCSWGVDDPSPALAIAMQYADSFGVIALASIGNNNEHALTYPGAISFVIGVAATDSFDRKASFSNYTTFMSGFRVGLSAPGVDVLSLRAAGTDLMTDRFGLPAGSFVYPPNDPTGEYYILSGTSMACPHVAGGVALLLSVHPGWSAADIVSQIQFTGDEVSGLTPEHAGGLGYGRLNLERALTDTVVPRVRLAGLELVDDERVYEPNEEVVVAASISAYAGTAEDIQYWIETDDPYLEVIDDGPRTAGDVGFNASKALDELRILILEDAPYPSKASFDLVVTSSTGPTERIPVEFDVSYPLRDGWPFIPSPRERSGALKTAELNADGDAKLVSIQDGSLQVVQSDGTLAAGYWPVSVSDPTGLPAIGDLDADPELEIVLCDEGNGVLVALDADGTPVSFRWPIDVGVSTGECFVTLVDVDADGRDEILYAKHGTPEVHLLSSEGTPWSNAWPIHVPGVVSWHPAVGDLEGDGTTEVVVNSRRPGDFVSSTLNVYGLDGQPSPGFPLDFVDGVRAAPMLADVDRDGDLEILSIAESAPTWRVRLLSHDGTDFSSSWPINIETTSEWGPFTSVPANLDDDEELEILIIGGRTPRVFAFDLDGNPLEGWPAEVNQPGLGLNPFQNWIGSVADLTGDGNPEIAIATPVGPYVFDRHGDEIVGMAPLRLPFDAPGAPTKDAIVVMPDSVLGGLDLLVSTLGYVSAYWFPEGDPTSIQWNGERGTQRNTGSHDFPDCNRNGGDDRVELSMGRLPDCNENGQPDSCDFADGVSVDLNTSGIPDECESFAPFDANGDGSVDLLDYRYFAMCLMGTDEDPAPIGPAACERIFDQDSSGEPDLREFASFVNSFGS